MTRKPVRHAEHLEVFYYSKRWALLEELRDKAVQTMEVLESAQLEPIVHGSIARGDVNAKSDIDIFVATQISSFTVETVLEKAGISISKRVLVQATPTYSIKAHVEIDENTTISFPLMKMRRVETEFYRFGGQATLENLRKKQRSAGVDKRLMLIEPTEEGHVESTVAGQEEHVARLLGISVDTVLDRVHALLRRDKIGRTGVFIKRELRENESFELVLSRMAKQNPAVHRRLTSLR
jgi:predicted nucleotidyltransferase